MFLVFLFLHIGQNRPPSPHRLPGWLNKRCESLIMEEKVLRTVSLFAESVVVVWQSCSYGRSHL